MAHHGPKLSSIGLVVKTIVLKKYHSVVCYFNFIRVVMPLKETAGHQDSHTGPNANWERQKPHDKDCKSIPDSPQTLFSIITEFGVGYSSAHGLPNVFKSTSSWGRVIWILICIGCMAAVFAQMYFLTKRYFAYHTAAEVC